ncbi:MmcB family DNA repair protein [uncultured Granulicatella sp.]|uniref:MmcB family DNA repair protein n=1 Tax=uncultured Granulicatella sp. TaxID=316089 RepID=UPI0028DC73F8|nr:MmcB family DNA repair protein [uncultured Granulicatella sp.]
MKSPITNHIEYLIFKHTNKLGTYGCREVKIGGVKTKRFITDNQEFVDYMTITSDGEITCYEIKSSLDDIKSNSRLSFYGHKNYFVMPIELYNDICDESWFLRKLENHTVGVISVNKFDELKVVKKCKNKKLSIGTQTILLESFAKSTARDVAKLYQLEKSSERRLSSKQIDDLLDEIVTEEFVKNAIEEFGKGVIE